MTLEIYTMDNLPPDISASLCGAPAEYFGKHGKLPPRPKWRIMFGSDRKPPDGLLDIAAKVIPAIDAIEGPDRQRGSVSLPEGVRTLGDDVNRAAS